MRDNPRVSAALGVTTDRLHLTLLGAADADDLFAVLNDVRLHDFIGGTPPTREQLRQRFARWELRAAPDGGQRWLNWVVRIARTGIAVGYVQATVEGNRASIAYVIGTSWSRQGIATEAVIGMCEALRRHLGIDSFEAHVHPAHLTSARVAQNAGLAPTGQFDDQGEELWTSDAHSDTMGSGKGLGLRPMSQNPELPINPLPEF
jgi:RimJ/RimL family protein N-acetyltransferase